MVMTHLIFNSFYLGEDVVLVMVLISDTYYFGEGVVVFKELICNSF